MWTRPGPDECAAYYQDVIRLAPDGALPELAIDEGNTLSALLAGLSEPDSLHAWAPDKWSIREVVGHIADTERVMGFRALCFARGDRAELPEMDQEDYARAAGHRNRSLASLLGELGAVRGATVSLMRSLDPEALDRTGVASGFRFTVRALCYHTVGHAIHHRRELEKRYLPGIMAAR